MKKKNKAAVVKVCVCVCVKSGRKKQLLENKNRNKNCNSFLPLDRDPSDSSRCYKNVKVNIIMRFKEINFSSGSG